MYIIFVLVLITNLSHAMESNDNNDKLTKPLNSLFLSTIRNKRKKPAQIPSLMQICAYQIAKELLNTKLGFAEKDLLAQQVQQIIPDDKTLRNIININLSALSFRCIPEKGILHKYVTQISKRRLRLIDSIDQFCLFQSDYVDDYTHLIFDTQKGTSLDIFANGAFRRNLHLFKYDKLYSIGIKNGLITLTTISENQIEDFPIKPVSDSFPYIGAFPSSSSITELVLCNDNYLIVRYSNRDDSFNVYNLHMDKNKKSIIATLCYSFHLPTFEFQKIIPLKNNSFLMLSSPSPHDIANYSIMDCRSDKVIKKWKTKERDPLYGNHDPALDVDQTKQLVAFYQEKNSIQISSLKDMPGKDKFLAPLAMLEHKGPPQSVRFLSNNNFVMVSTERGEKHPDTIYIWYWPTSTRVFKYTMPNPNLERSCTYIFTGGNKIHLPTVWRSQPIYSLDLNRLPAAEEIKKEIDPCYKDEALLCKLDTSFYASYSAYIKDTPIPSAILKTSAALFGLKSHKTLLLQDNFDDTIEK